MTTTPESEYKPVVHVSDDWRRIEFPRGIVPPKGGDLYSAATLAQMQAEIDRLQAAHDHQYGVAGTMLREAERAESELSAAKELLRELAPYIKGYCEIHCKALCESGCPPAELMVRYDAFLQEKI